MPVWVKGKVMINNLKVGGKYRLQHIRNGEVIHEEDFPNGITNEGKMYLLDAAFNNETDMELSDWNLGLIDLGGFTALAPGDSYAQIGGTNQWSEFTDYKDSGNEDSTETRPAWTKGAASNNIVTNALPVDFEITDSGTVKGVFCVGGADADTKGDSTGGNVLFGTALFSSGDRAVLPTDILRVTYAVMA